MWSHFVIAAVVIFFSGRYLSDLADETADLTGLSKGFIGALILGVITSLPELIGTLSAVLFKDNPDLGVGNIFGSNLFNLAILSAVILVFSSRIPSDGWKWHSNFPAYLSISLSAFMVMLIGMYMLGVKTSSILSDLLIVGFYLIGMWLYSQQGGESNDLLLSVRTGPKRSLVRNIILLVVFGMLVVAAGVLLADACNDIANQTNLTSTFVGSLFMAAATSLPELVVTLRLLSLGNISMATGNIFGSNMMNLTIIALADIFYRGSMYATISDSQLVTLGAGILMSGIFLSGSLVKGSKRIVLHIDNISIIFIYLLVYFWLYNH